MFEEMSFEQLNERILENADRGILTTNKLAELCEDKHIISMIRECFEQIAEDAIHEIDSVHELNLN